MTSKKDDVLNMVLCNTYVAEIVAEIDELTLVVLSALCAVANEEV